MRVLFFILIPISIFADIDAEIEAIQKAPAKERYKLMNRFKNKILKMRQKERLEALKIVQRKTKTKLPQLSKKGKEDDLKLEDIKDIEDNCIQNSQEEIDEKDEDSK